MPTYALLGATGATGSSVLRFLLTDPPKGLAVNILVRSKAKLMKAFPHLEETSLFRVTIFEGTSTNSRDLQKCLTGVDAILVCVGSNESKPGQTLMYDTAAAIIDTLKTLQKLEGDAHRTPTVLMLRAAPINATFAAQTPAPVRFLLNFCLHFGYLDLRKAGELYLSAVNENPELLQVIFIDPGALYDADGTERTGYKLVLDEKLNPVLNYADLGAAICEVAEHRNEFQGKGVGVSATGEVRINVLHSVRNLFGGAKNRLLHAAGRL